MTGGGLKNDHCGPTVAARNGAYAAAPNSTLRKFTYIP
jgi:hypothetical protein